MVGTTHTYSRREELANAITHGLGALLSIAALVLLIIMSSLDGSVWRIVSFTLYGTTMVLLYTFSTLLHSFPEGKVKDLFEIFDHASIFLFIAGTYTPFLMVTLRGQLAWTLFGIVWGIAIGGIVFKAFYVKRFVFLSTMFYILMGWMIVFVWKPLQAALPMPGTVLLIIGGVLYTLGTVFYIWRSFPYHHAVWHVFVLGGSILHFLAILLYV